MLRQILLNAILGLCTLCSAQTMTSGEYWLDADPGIGHGIPFDFPDQAEVSVAAFNIPATGLSIGIHVIGIRTRTADADWSHTNLFPVNIIAQPVSENIQRSEYFLNVDPGFGAGANANADGLPDVMDASFTTSLTGLEPGINILFTRSQDAQGRWSHTNAQPFNLVQTSSQPEISRTEYFLNTDPGFGSGFDAGIGGSNDLMNANLLADLSGAPLGVNELFIRSVDVTGKWSHTNSVPVLVEDSTTSVIVRMEYFWDEDPGFGLGMVYDASTSSSDLMNEVDSVAVPGSFQNNSYHRLYVRSLDSRGRWSHTNITSGTDSIWVDLTSTVDELGATANISVYPNPFNDGFNVKTEDDGPLRVILYDPQGKLVYDRVITGNTQIDLSREASGSYTAFFWKDLNVIHRVKLVKQ